jgi:hypothetical protein
MLLGKFESPRALRNHFPFHRSILPSRKLLLLIPDVRCRQQALLRTFACFPMLARQIATRNGNKPVSVLMRQQVTPDCAIVWEYDSWLLNRGEIRIGSH